MPVRRVKEDEWPSLCRRIATALMASRVEAALTSNDEVPIVWATLRDIRYDHEGDVFALMVDGQEQRILRPLHVEVDETAIGLRALRVADTNGTVRVLQFRSPVPLPALAKRHVKDGLYRPAAGAA